MSFKIWEIHHDYFRWCAIIYFGVCVNNRYLGNY